MSKYVETGIPKKTVGAYLKVVKALKELDALGENTGFHPWDPVVVGATGRIYQDHETGEWTYADW